MNGGGCNKIVEPSLTVCETFDTAWKPTIVDREKVISLYKSGASRNSIAIQLGVARATISKIIQTVGT